MLLAQPIPWADEAPAGVLMRAASMNGWKDVSCMLAASGIVTINTRFSWKTLQRYLRHLESYGIQMPDSHQPGERNFRGTKKRPVSASLDLPLAVFRDECAAVCPECLAAKPYIRHLWSVKAYIACHLHGFLLIDVCPQCSTSLSWMRPAPERCVCNYDLRLSPRIDSSIEASEYIAYAIEKGEQDRLNTIASTFCALEEAFSDQRTIQIHALFTEVAIKNDEELLDFLVTWVAKRVHTEHPRLVLLPFFRSNGRLKEIAKTVLERLHDLRIPPKREGHLPGSLTFLDSAHALGLTKHGVLPRLDERRLLESAAVAHESCLQRFTRASVDSLLRRLWTPSSASSIQARRLALTTPLDVLSQQLLADPASNAGYDLVKGLSGLRRMPGKAASNNSFYDTNTFGVDHAAKKLNIHPAIVRSLIRTRYLKPIKAVHGTQKVILSKSAVARFDGNYICAGALARSVGATSTRFSEKLFSYGVKPVGGPGIDGLSIYLFARKDIAGLDLQAVKLLKGASLKIIPASQSRDSMVGHILAPVSIKTVMSELGLSVREVTKLVHKGILVRVESPQPAVTVSRLSFFSFKKIFTDKTLADLAVVAKQIGETLQEFRARWIVTGMVKVIDLGIRQCITQKDYQCILTYKNNFLTAKEAAHRAGKGRFFFPNLEKRGIISSVRLGTEGKLRLYSRADIDHIFGNE